MLALLLCTASACAGNQVQPVVGSPAGQTGYALGYPDVLAAETAALVADGEQAAELTQGLGQRTQELKPGADPELIFVIAKQADEAGRSRAYAEALEDGRALGAFWEEERGPLTSRVNGAAQKQVAEAGCAKEPDLGGAISYALKDGLDKQVEKRLRDRNEAHRTIDRNKAALGTGNVARAQKLADDIAMSSYLVNIALVRDRDRVAGLVSERSDVDGTLGDAIEWEQSYQQGDHSAAEKKASQQEMAALEKARAAIPPAAEAAEASLKDLDPKIENARKAHEAALDELKQALETQQQTEAAK